jgi:hypothetical protein
MKPHAHVALLSLFLLVLAAPPGLAEQRINVNVNQDTFVISNEAPGYLITKLINAGHGADSVYQATQFLASMPGTGAIIWTAFLSTLANAPYGAQIFTTTLAQVLAQGVSVSISTDGTARFDDVEGVTYAGTFPVIETGNGTIQNVRIVHSTESQHPLNANVVQGPLAGMTTTYNAFAVAWALPDSLSSCSYAVSTPDLAVPAAGGTMALTIHTGSGCPWSVTGLPDWLTVSGSSSGTGPATVTLAASPGVARTALVSVAGVSVPVRQLESSACAGSVSCTVRVLTHVAFGGQWTTDLVALSSETNPGSFYVSFFGDTGAAVALPFTVGDLSTLTGTVPAQGRKDYEATNPAVADQGAWGLVTADGSLTLQAVFRRRTADSTFYEAAVPTSAGYSSFIVPFDATTFAPTGVPMYTGFAIVNLNPSATAHIACTARDDLGTIVADAVSLPAVSALGHYTAFSFPALVGKRGTFDCTADTLVSALALRAIGGDGISTLPVIVK